MRPPTITVETAGAKAFPGLKPTNAGNAQMKFYSSNHLHAFIWDHNALANKAKKKIKINGNAHKENRVCNMPRYCHTRHRGLIRELQASTRVESASPGERSTVNTCSRLRCCGKRSPAEGEVFSHNKNTSPERFLHQTPRERWQPTTHFHHKFHKKWYIDSGGGVNICTCFITLTLNPFMGLCGCAAANASDRRGAFWLR